MAQVSAAEIAVDVPLVRRLLQEQYPRLAEVPVQQAPSGCDNHIFRLGTSHTVRLPRHGGSVHKAATEHRWLPLLAPQLPVAVPVPEFRGRPSSAFPWQWSICRWFDGQDASCQPRDRNRILAAPLAAFLNALHVTAPAGLSEGPRGSALPDQDEAVQERISSGMIPHAARIRELWMDTLTLPAWPGAAVWVHGDLHPGNLVVRQGVLQAVIDFGDLSAGDPAADLAAAWLVFDPAGRQELWNELGQQYDGDPAVWDRARGWALCMATALLDASGDVPGLYLLGSETLMEILTEQRGWF